LYLVGTSIGLFATDNLDGQNTVWEMIGKDEIGNVIIEQIDYRHSDGRFTVATYGRGIFQTTITSVDDVLSLDNVERKQLSIYPNPTSDIINVEFTANKSEKVKCIIYNEVGKQVKSYFEKVITGTNKLTFDVNTLKTGVYFVSLHLENETITNQFIKK
jgi:hypothetical protein